jgi:hypothetical protein
MNDIRTYLPLIASRIYEENLSSYEIEDREDNFKDEFEKVKSELKVKLHIMLMLYLKIILLI